MVIYPHPPFHTSSWMGGAGNHHICKMCGAEGGGFLYLFPENFVKAMEDPYDAENKPYLKRLRALTYVIRRIMSESHRSDVMWGYGTK